MESLDIKVERFLTIGNGYGYGNGYGDGDGYGYGNGYGSGDGDGDGYGDGNGYGDGSGDGDGDGYGDGNGYGNGYGNGNGYGYGDGHGNGYGYGDGDGYGNGYGNGDGNGDGNGYGDGDGDGHGNGYGYGDSIQSIDGQRVYMIDDLPTVIHAVRGNIARGGIMQRDWSLKRCYVARVGDCFAHGATVHDAWHDAQAKLTQQLPVEERIRMFNEQFPDRNKRVAVKTLYDWHGILTGSCRIGRNEFAKSYGIDIEHDTMSVNDFIKLTADSYGGYIIKQL